MGSDRCVLAAFPGWEGVPEPASGRPAFAFDVFATTSGRSLALLGRVAA